MSSLKERIEEFLDDAKGRIYNPLILSFIIVWLYFHWKFLYEIFTVSDSIDVLIRSGHFKTYVNNQGWCGMIGKPLFISIGSLAVFYILRIVGSTIKVLLGKTLFYRVMVQFDKSNYVSIADHKKIKDENKDLRVREETQNDEIKSLKSTLRQREKEIEILNGDAIKKQNEFDETIGQLNGEKKILIQEKNAEIAQHQETNKKYNVLQERNEQLEKSNKDLNTKVLEIWEVNKKINMGNKISINFESIFPKNSRWTAITYGQIPLGEVLVSIESNFYSENKKLRYLVSAFQYDSVNNIVSFTLNTNEHSTSEMKEIKMIVQNNGELLSGGDGNSTITYTKIR